MNERPPSPERHRPHGLWSLWEIMKPFRPSIFTLIGEASGLFWGAQREDKFAQNLSDKLDEETRNKLVDSDKRAFLFFEYMLNGVEKDFVELELTVSLAALRRMQEKLKDAAASEKSMLGEICSLQEDLKGRIIDELDGRFFWSLTTEEAEYYKNPRKGWEKIIERFPTAVSDIEEASKCFALSRYAAAVFHSLQIVEIGVIALGKIIEVTDPQRGWTATSRALKKIIDTQHQYRTAFQKDNFAFLEQMNMAIEALKNAWRNKISHAQGKSTLLTADFSEEIAKEILLATRSFMRRLATDAPASVSSPGEQPS